MGFGVDKKWRFTTMAVQKIIFLGKSCHPMRFWGAVRTFGNGSVGFNWVHPLTLQETAPGLILFYDGSDAEMVEWLGLTAWVVEKKPLGGTKMKWALWGDGLVGGRGRGCLDILILDNDDLFIEHWPSRIYTQWPDIGYIYMNIWILLPCQRSPKQVIW